MNKFILFFIIFILSKNLLGSEAYFELSEKEIQIQTDFTGKEVIIFGVFEEGEDTIITIEGPKKNIKIRKKEKILGFWFNTKNVIFKDLPSLFFVASSSPIQNILSQETIIKEKLYFDELLINTITQRNFVEQKYLNEWNKNLIKIKQNTNLYKEYNFQNIDNKLFHTEVYFPAQSIPGKYKVTIYQIKNKLISNKKDKIIIIKKSGIGDVIFRFAHNEPATYGLLSILFAILSGLIAATIFRRL